jgi:hypothetical protein
MTTLNLLFELRESEIGNVVQRGPRTDPLGGWIATGSLAEWSCSTNHSGDDHGHYS